MAKYGVYNVLVTVLGREAPIFTHEHFPTEEEADKFVERYNRAMLTTNGYVMGRAVRVNVEPVSG